MLGEITLITQLNSSETVQNTVFCEVQDITQSEFAAAGQKDRKPKYKFVVWAFEYQDETEIEYNGQRLTVYRTFRRQNEEKIELYTEKRLGRH